MPNPRVLRPPGVQFIGALRGDRPDRVLMPDETLARLLSSAGVPVRASSCQVGRLHRLLDTLAQAARWRNEADVAVISAVSGLGFVMADVGSTEMRLLGVPVIITLHGGNLPELATRHARWVDRVLGRASALVAPSRYLAE